MSRMQQQQDMQRRRNPGTAKEAATGDPLLDDNPYFCEEVRRSYLAQEHGMMQSAPAC